jgi:hypothetical protein
MKIGKDVILEDSVLSLLRRFRMAPRLCNERHQTPTRVLRSGIPASVRPLVSQICEYTRVRGAAATPSLKSKSMVQARTSGYPSGSNKSKFSPRPVVVVAQPHYCQKRKFSSQGHLQKLNQFSLDHAPTPVPCKQALYNGNSCSARGIQKSTSG